ncbi:Tat pathway signal protein [Gammaproteobacteria bacterium 45_16_T64]|nr:Tat pathway signal protein [Gammaproteobacteria bacterium 45_16_T64]
MKMTHNRRRFLRNMMIGGAGMSLANFSNLAMAAGDASKLKVVFCVIPDGFGVDPHGGYDGIWFPVTNEKDTTNFQLNEMSQHLGSYAKQSLFLQGTLLSSGTGGHNGWQTILRDSAGKNTSIDLLLGSHMPGNNASIKRIYSGPHATVGASWNISYQNSNMLVPEISPYQLFDKVFDGVTSGGSSQSIDTRAHLFDPINDQIQSLRGLLGTTERAKLDTHLDSVEQVVTDLNNSVPSTGGSCSPNTHQPTANMAITSADYRDEVTKAHADVIAGGLSCGVSRVATFQIGRSADQVVIKSVSTTRNPHDCAHRYGSVDEWLGSRAWYVQQYRYLLDQLASMPDPDVPGDNLLDHTLVVFTSEMADGAPEHMQDVPITLTGGASGLLNNGSGNGRFFSIQDQGDRSHWKMGTAVDLQRVWTTIAAACGTTTGWGGDVSTLSGIFTNV